MSELYLSSDCIKLRKSFIFSSPDWPCWEFVRQESRSWRCCLARVGAYPRLDGALPPRKMLMMSVDCDDDMLTSGKFSRSADDTNEGKLLKYLLLFLQHVGLTRWHTHGFQALMSSRKTRGQVGRAVLCILSWLTLCALTAPFSFPSSASMPISFTKLPLNPPCRTNVFLLCPHKIFICVLLMQDC